MKIMNSLALVVKENKISVLGACFLATLFIASIDVDSVKAKDNTPVKVETCLDECEKLDGSYIEFHEKKNKVVLRCADKEGDVITTISKKCSTLK